MARKKTRKAAFVNHPQWEGGGDEDESPYRVIQGEGGFPVKAWVRGVPLEEAAEKQLKNVARLPFIHKHVAAMPDVHWGLGATVGSVIPTRGAIIPAAVGVDIGCGMMAVQTNLTGDDLPDTLDGLRADIEKTIPHGRTRHGGRGDRGAWGHPPKDVEAAWTRKIKGTPSLAAGLDAIVEKHPKIGQSNNLHHLGTLGTGNHFIELCLDQDKRLWVMLHSGSRGVGNRIGTYFIEAARREMAKWFINLPDKDLAYLPERTPLFDDYVQAVDWAQRFAETNREIMMDRVLDVLEEAFPHLEMGEVAVNCHHNYVERENHFGANVWVTRKGAVRARQGEWGIIPGSMGARSYIVRGKGNPEAFDSCSHGAGRAMSRGAAKKRFTLEDHAKATAGVACRKDKEVLDETPGAYKDIDAVMAAQEDLVEPVFTLKQVVCVKG